MKHGRIFIFVLTAGIFMLAQNLAAQWTGSASAPVAVTDSADNQTYPFVFSDGGGGVLVPYFADSANWGVLTNIFVQRLDNTGTPQWGTNGVQAEDSPDNIIYDTWTKSAAVVSDDHGGVIAVYKRGTASYEDIYASRINAAGTKIWGVDVEVNADSGTQQNAAAISDGQGGAFVAWETDKNGTNDIYIQRIDSSGNVQWGASGVAACSLAQAQSKPALVKDGTGGVIVTWSDYRNFRYDVYGQRFDAAGTPLWSVGGTMLYQDTEMMDVVGVTMTYGGNGHILMGLIQPMSTDRYLKAQKIDTLGNRIWGTSGVQLDYSTTIDGVNVFSDGADGMISVWHREWTSQVVARRVGAGGSLLWGSNLQLSDGTDYCMYPRVVNDSTGTFMAVWSDSSDIGGGSFIKAQRFDVNGTMQWDNGGTVIGKGTGYRSNPAIFSDTPGQAVVVWNENDDFAAYDIAAQQIPLPPPIPNVYNWMKDKYYTTLAEALDSTENDSGDIIFLLKDTTVQVTATMDIPVGVTVAPAGTVAAAPVFDAAGFNGVVFRMHNGSALTGIHIAGAESSAVYADNCYSGLDVNNCVVESCATRNGIPALYFYYCDKVRVRGNTFYEASGSVTGVPLVKFEGGNGSVVVNNMFLGTYAVGLELYSINSGQGVEVRHNLFDGFANNGALHNSNADYIHVANNIFTNNQTAVIDSFSGMGFEVEGNAYFNNTANSMSAVDPAAVMADPVFADAGNDDFHLSYHSPCIDAGHADSVWIDRDGSRPDIGPYGGPFADTTGIPPYIGNFHVINGSGYDTLSWSMSPVGNFQFYAVYRDTVDSAGFKIGASTMVCSIATVALTDTVLSDAGKLWTYRICAVNSDGHAGGYGEASGHAPVLVQADYEDLQTTMVDDDTLFLKFSMPVDTGYLAMYVDSHFVFRSGYMDMAMVIPDTMNDSVVKVSMQSFNIRPESVKVMAAGVRGQNGVLSLEGDFLPVKNPSPFLRRALYQDNGTPAWGDDVVTLIFSAPVADSSVELAAKQSRLDFAMPYGSIDSATTVTGIPNDETLFVQLHWQDSPGEFFYVKPFAVQDSGGARSLVDTTLVWVENISRPYVDSIWPANAETMMVETWDTILVRFSRGIDGSSLDDQNFKVYGSLHGRYGGSLSYDPWTRQAGFNPDSMFANGEQITCVITRGVLDSTGTDSLARPYVWSFRVRTTGGTDSLGSQPYWTVHDTGAAVTSIAWADVDGNRYPDLIVGRSGKSNLVYFNQNGHLDFMPGWHSTELEDTRDIAVADINDDGWPDLVCANYGQNSRVYLGDGSSFNASYAWSSTNTDNSRAVVAADIDGNGYPDIILGNDGQSDAVYFNYGGSPELTPSWTSTLGFQTYGIRAVDVNNDGNVDLVCAANDRNVVYRNFGDSLAADTSWSTTNINFSNAVDAGDMDRDGDYDLVFANDVALQNTWYRTLLPDSVLGTPWWNSSNTSQSQDVQVADMDGDGDYDLAFANRGAPHAVYYNTGSVQTIPSWTAGATGAGNALALADVDLDGDMDMACLDSVGGSVVLGIHLAGDAPPWIDSLRMSQDTTGRDTVAPGLVYIDFYGADIEGDSFAVNDAYFATDDTNSWTWFSTSGGGFNFIPAGSTYTALWFSGMDTAIESDSVWLKMSFWEPIGSFTSDNIKAGPFSIDTRAPALSGSLQVAGATDSSITLSWGAATDMHFSRYEIWYDTTWTVDADSSDSLWGLLQDPLLANIGTASATITGLRSGMPYWFRLRAVDSLGNDTMTAYTAAGTTFVFIQGYVADSLTHGPLGGIEVVIYRDSMAFYVPLDTVLTDAGGSYLFDKIRVDTDYKLLYNQPGGNSVWYNNQPDSFSANNLWCTMDTVLDTAFMPPVPMFMPVITAIDSIKNGRGAWADYDLDGDLDVVVSGDLNGGGTGQTRLFRNDGGMVFNDAAASLPNVYNGTVVWADYDADGDPDLLVSGDAGSFTAATYLYRNEGGSFTDVSAAAGLTAMLYTAAGWADFDGDGDLDLCMTGMDAGMISRMFLYRNEGADSFSVADSTLDSLYNGDVDWVDYDRDGDMDLLVVGERSGTGTATLYRNDGGVLSDAAAGLLGILSGSADWGDYDNDGDPDILLTGDEGSSMPVSILYRNTAGSFAPVDPGIDSIYTGAAAWIDFDNDGWLDIVQTGYDNTSRISEMYRSEAGTSFVKIAAGLEGFNYGYVAAADADNDRRTDLLLNGENSAVITVTGLYQNTTPDSNLSPQAPVNPGVTPSPDTTYFFWNAATDSTTPDSALTYNIALGTTDSTFDVISPMADPATGYRHIPARGNVGQDTVFRMAGLAPGTYYWQVQAIDHSYAGSPFTALDSFDVAVDTMGPVVVKIDYRSNGTLDASDDSLFVTFSEKIVFDSLNLTGSGAGSDFNLLGYRASVANVTTAIGADDSSVVLTFTGADTILSRNRAQLVLLAGAVYDSLGNACPAGTVTVNTWNVLNAASGLSFTTVDSAQLAASANDTIYVFDEGYYTEALHITQDLVFSAAGHGMPVIKYDTDKYNLFLVYADNGTGVSVDFNGFEFNGMNAANTDTVTKLMRIDGGSLVNCVLKGQSSASLYLVETVNAGSPIRSLVIKDCMFEDGVGGGINWTKQSAGSYVTQCKFTNLGAGSGAIFASSADSTVISHNLIDVSGFAGIYFEAGCDENLIAMNLVKNATQGINLGASGAGQNNRILFNTVYGCGSMGITVRSDGSDTVMYNIAYGSTNDLDTNASGSMRPVADYNCYGSVTEWVPGVHSLNQDPLFLNAAADSFMLDTLSPCLAVSDVDSAKAEAMLLADMDFEGQQRPMPSGTYWDLGAFEEQTVLILPDTDAPDADVYIKAASIDSNVIELTWSPSLIESTDAESVTIRYRTDGSFPVDQTDGILVGAYTLADSVDTLIGLTMDTEYRFGAFVVDSAGNWSSSPVNAQDSFYLYQPASVVYADVLPDTAVAGKTDSFVVLVIPADGTIDKAAVVSPDGGMTALNGVMVNGVALTLGNGNGHPATTDSARISFVSSESLYVFLSENRVKAGDTLSIAFNDSMPAATGLDSTEVWAAQVFRPLDPCAPLVPGALQIVLEPGALASYQMSVPAYAWTAGVAVPCTLEARDAYFNILTNYDTTGITYMFSGPLASPDGSGFIPPADQAVKDSFMSPTSGGSVGRAVVSLTIYNAAQCSISFTESITALSAVVDSIMVLHDVIDSMGVAPAGTTITADDSVYYSAKAFDAYGNPWDVTDSISTVWSATGVAAMSANVYYADSSGVFQVSAANGGVADTVSITVNPGAIISLQLSPDTAYITADSTLILSATAMDADSNVWIVTDTSTGTVWGDDDPVADVDNGSFMGVLVDTSKVWAVNDGVSDTCVVFIDHGAVTTVMMSPATATVTADSVLALTLTAQDAAVNMWDVTDLAVWSGPGSKVAVDSGRYEADSVGVWDIRADFGGFADSSAVTVTTGAVAGLVVAPAGTSITSDESVSLAAYANDGSGNIWEVTDIAVWSGLGSVSPIDSGMYDADTAGTWDIRADYGGYADSSAVTVGNGAVVSLVLDIDSAYITTDSTLDLTATAADGAGNTWDATDSTAGTVWGDNDSAVVTVNGVYDAVGTGGYRIWAQNGGVSDTCHVFVNPGAPISVTVTPATGTVTADSILVLTAAAMDADSNTWDVSDLAVWSGPGSASPVDTGKYAADTAGIWDVRADYGGFADSCAVTVVPGDIVAIGITPSTAVIPTDSVLVLTATATDLSGNQWNATDTLIWMTDDVSVSVDSGRYDPDSSGSYKVWAYYSIHADTCLVTVNPGAAIALKAEGLSDTVVAGDTVVYSLTAMDADSVFWDVTAQATWEVTPNTGVDTSGANVIPTLAGSYTVVGHYLALTDTVMLEVTPAMAESIVVTSPAVAGSVLTGDAFAITAAVYDKYGNVAEDSQYVQWYWFDPDGGNVGGGEGLDSVASPVISGVATMTFTHSDQPGDNYRIEAVVNGVADTSAVMTVKARPLYSVVIVGADSATPVGDLTIDTDNDTTVFFAHGYDSLGTSLGLVSGSAWSIIEAAVGTLTNDTSHTTILTATTPGMARIVVSVSPVITDTTGYITVGTGVMAGLTVAPAGTSIASDDTLYLLSTANDADGNTWDITADGGSNWNTDDISGSVMNGIYVPQQTGSWKVWNDNNGFSDTALVTVTFGTMTDIVLSPDTAVSTADSVLHFSVYALDAAGNTSDITGDSSIVWETRGSDTPVSGGTYYADTAGTWLLGAVFGAFGDTSTIIVSAGAPAALGVLPGTAAIPYDSSLQLTAVAVDTDGNETVVTGSAVWSTDDTLGGTVSAGMYVPAQAGVFHVWSVYGGLSDTTLVTVEPGTLDSITLVLSATAVPAGSTVVCTVLAYYGGGAVKDVSDTASITLSSTVGVTSDSNRITATLAGTYTVTAGYQGLNRNMDFTVQALSSPDSVAFLAPAQPETVAAGAWVPCTLAVFDMYGNVITDPVTLVLAAIDPVGDNAGTGTVTPMNVATSGGKAAAMLVVSSGGGDNFAVTATYLGTVLDTSLTVTVENNKIAQLKIIYADSTGSPVDTLLTTDDDSLKLVAVGLDSAGTVVGTIDSCSWTVSDTLIASVIPTAGPPAIMMLYGTGNMVVSVSAMVDGQSLTATTDTISVVAGKPAVLTVSPDSTELLVNQGRQFTVSGTDADGNITAVKPLWSLSSTTVGAIDTNGYFTATDTGSVTVQASDGGVTGSAYVLVKTLDVPLDRIVIKGAQEITVSADSTVSFAADGYDENDSLVDVGGLVQWQVTDSTVLKADSAGTGYEAVRAGSTLVIGSVDSLADTVVVIVSPGAMVTATLDQGDTLVGAGVTVQYTVSAYDADGNAVTAAYTWSLSDNGVGSVADGSFRGTRAGSTWVYAAYGTFADSAFVRIIDDIAPQARVTVEDSSIDEASARITISAADTLDHTGTPAESLAFAYRVNGGAWQTADSSVIDLFPLDDGAYTVGVKVTDGAGNVDSSQQVTFTVHLGGLEVPAQRWQLISIPKDVKGAAIGQLITADTTNTVHLYRWSESADTDPFSLKYLDVADDALVPGFGYWLLTSAVSGLQLDSTTEFITGPDTIALQDGWNMIGNPYGYTISLRYDSIATNGFLGTVSMEEAVATGLVENVMHGFNGLSDTVEYTPVSHMGGTGARPWQGYWLKANGAYDLILDGRPYRPQETAVKQAAVMQDWNDWTLNLTARAGLARDRYNSVGIKPGAAAGQDRYDASEPPQMSPFVSLGMVRDGRLLSADYQDGDGDVREWYFRVSTDAAGEQVTLGWDGLDRISPAIGFYLYDLRDGTVTDLRRQDHLSYRASAGDRHFKLVASGSIGFVPDQLPERAAIGDIAPNPVRDRALIPFAVPAENRTVSPVRLGVYDLAGNLVRQLVADNLPAGSYAVSWDGRDGSGRRVAGGLYFCRLSSDTWTAARQFEVLQK